MKCLDCQYMDCKIYYVKQDSWEGYCCKHKIIVEGNTLCKDEQITEIDNNIPDAVQLLIKW